jgi:hypothetical protein
MNFESHTQLCSMLIDVRLGLISQLLYNVIKLKLLRCNNFACCCCIVLQFSVTGQFQDFLVSIPMRAYSSVVCCCSCVLLCRYSQRWSWNYMFWNISPCKKKLHGLSPRANLTDRATAACRRSNWKRLRIEGATWLAWRIPKAVFSVFQTGAATFISSSSSVVLTRLSAPRYTPITFFSGSAGNGTQASGSVDKNSDH